MANYLAAILIVAAVALFVAAPLSGGFPRRRRSTILQLDLERLEHERGLAVQGLRELEFDHEMGKLDEVDYRDLQRALEDRALFAMTAIERVRTIDRDAEGMAQMRLAARPPRPASALGIAPSVVPASGSAATSGPALTPGTAPVHGVATAPGPAPRAATTRRMSGAGGAGHPPPANFCPQCGVRVGTGHNFCAACGANLSPAAARTASRAE